MTPAPAHLETERPSIAHEVKQKSATCGREGFAQVCAKIRMKACVQVESQLMATLIVWLFVCLCILKFIYVYPPKFYCFFDERIWIYRARSTWLSLRDGEKTGTIGVPGARWDVAVAVTQGSWTLYWILWRLLRLIVKRLSRWTRSRLCFFCETVTHLPSVRPSARCLPKNVLNSIYANTAISDQVLSTLVLCPLKVSLLQDHWPLATLRMKSKR